MIKNFTLIIVLFLTMLLSACVRPLVDDTLLAEMATLKAENEQLNIQVAEKVDPISNAFQCKDADLTEVPAKPLDWHSDVFTQTAIEVKRGDIMAFIAWGEWDVGAGLIGPDGSETPCDCTVSEISGSSAHGALGALIGRIGTQGKPFLIGSQQIMTAAEDGALFLSSNDNFEPCAEEHGSCYDDNQGTINVCIMMQSALEVAETTITNQAIASETSSSALACRVSNLLDCAVPIPVFVPDASHLVLTSGGLAVDFDNQQNGSGIALQFVPPLDANGFSHIEVSGTSNNEFMFQVEYKVKDNNQLTVAATSEHQSFPATRRTYTSKVPIAYQGQIDEIVFNFFEKGQAANLVLEAIQLVNEVDIQ